MALTGPADGAPALAPAALATCMAGALEALRILSSSSRSSPGGAGLVDGAALLGERAAFAGLERRGAHSPSGSCRLIASRDGWIAVNLPRASDWSLLPAWFEDVDDASPHEDPWSILERQVAIRSSGELVARARLLGLAVSEVVSPPTDAPHWFRERASGASLVRPPSATPLVVDLSSLWAGPLASHLLQLVGARVLKVESVGRPDGARDGHAAFFDLLNAGKESVALDFRIEDDRAVLRRLLDRADIVIEGSRPRALEQLGVDASSSVRARPGQVWISITAYGRRDPQARWIGFGDDTAAASGLSFAAGAAAGLPTPIICGDAIADPLTGAHAAVAAYAAFEKGRAVLLDVNLHDVCAHALKEAPMPRGAVVKAAGSSPEDPSRRAWLVVAGNAHVSVAPPSARTPGVRAAPLGAHTARVVHGLGLGPS